MRGRRPKFDEKQHPQLIKWMARAGLIDREICAELGIRVSTFNNWKKRYPAVMEALQTSRNFIDSLVEDSLLKRALGYEYEESRVTAKRLKGDCYRKLKDGTFEKLPEGQMVEQLQKVKYHVVADTTAAIFWLKNRRRPAKQLDSRLAWQDTYKLEQEAPPLEAPPVELTNDELAAEIRTLELEVEALRAQEGTAPAPGRRPKSSTLH